MLASRWEFLAYLLFIPRYTHGLPWHARLENCWHECICFQTRNHDTVDDASNHTTIFFILATVEKEFSALVTGLAGLYIVQAFSVSLCLSLSVLKKMLASRWEFLAYLLFILTLSRGMRVLKTAGVSSWTRPNCLPLKPFFSLPLGVRFLIPFLFITSLCTNFCSENHDPAVNSAWSGNYRCTSEWRKKNCHATRVQVQVSKAWLVIDMRLTCRLDVFSSLWLKKQGKSSYCNGSSLPLFSSTSFVRVLDNVSDSRWCCQISWTFVVFVRMSSSMLTIKKTFPEILTHLLSCISRHSNFAAGLSWTPGNKSLMRNAGSS